jgi:hypothetical protein
METAEDVVRKLFRECISAEPDGTPGGVAVIVAAVRAKEIIEADRNAIRLAAKLEVIREVERISENMRWNDDRNMLVGVCRLLREKFGADDGNG